MGPDPKILDDIARLAGGAVNVASGLHQQIGDEIKTRMEDMAARMDLVPREDLDQALSMIARQQEKTDALEKRIASLESRKGQQSKKKAPAKKTANTDEKTGKAGKK